MSVNLAPQTRLQYTDSNGNPYSGAKLFTYLNNTATKQATYTTSAQTTAHSNPIVLDSSGRPPAEVWLVSGVSYTFVLAPATDSDPPASPILTDNDITGVNDVSSSSTIDQWITGPTPTYVSAASFSLAGNQTVIFEPGRRLKLTLGASTVYATIASSVFGAATTVTIVVDNLGVIDNTLSGVSYSVLTATNESIPSYVLDAHAPGLVNGYIVWSMAAGALTATLTANNNFSAPTAGNPVYIKFRNSTIGASSLVTRKVTTALAVTASSGSKLGLVDAQSSRIYCVAVDTGAGVVLGLYNPLLYGTTHKVQLIGLDDSRVYSTTAEGGAGAADLPHVIYTAAAHVGKPIAILGWFESTQTTAGTWAQAAIASHTTKQGSYKTGDIISHTYDNDGAMVAFTDAIPEDDTIPQNGEGTNVLSIAYVSVSKANVLRVKSTVMMSSTGATGIQAALFQDAIANALVAIGDGILTADGRRVISLTWEGVTSLTSQTFYTAVGSTVGDTTINGKSSARYFGGVANTSCIIEEVWV